MRCNSCSIARCSKRNIHLFDRILASDHNANCNVEVTDVHPDKDPSPEVVENSKNPKDRAPIVNSNTKTDREIVPLQGDRNRGYRIHLPWPRYAFAGNKTIILRRSKTSAIRGTESSPKRGPAVKICVDDSAIASCVLFFFVCQSQRLAAVSPRETSLFRHVRDICVLPL